MIVDCAVYEHGHRRTGELPLEQACEASRSEGAFVWLGVAAPSREEFDAVAREFELHELAVEDAVKAHQRPKVEAYGHTLLVVVKTAHHVDRDNRAAVPLSAAVDQLARGHFATVPAALHDYFRDVCDHLQRLTGRVGGFRELLTSALNANLTQVAVRQNEDIRKISAWVAILAVPTMIAGLYGMNFDTMPELRWTYGYPLVLCVILVICTLLHRRFKRSGWL